MLKDKKGISLIVLVLIVVAIIVVGAVAIVLVINKGNDNTANSNNSLNTSNNNSQVTTNKNENTMQDTQNNSSTNILSGGTYKVPGKNIYVDVPNWQKMEKGYTELFILHGIKYIAFTANRDGTTENIAAAHDSAFKYFKQSIQNYSYVNSLTVKKDSTQKINGIDVYKYEGTLNCGHDTIYDAYVIGFSFILDGVPCNITGSVIAEDGKTYTMNGKQLTVDYDKEVTEMASIVEAMIQTVRTEK